MVDYTFYVEDYLGSAIPENAFSGMVAQAQRHINKWKRRYRVKSSGPEAENMALCAMAETLWSHRKEGLYSARVGSITVRYDVNREALAKELYDKAAIYLDIYRGWDNG